LRDGLKNILVCANNLAAHMAASPPEGIRRSVDEGSWAQMMRMTQRASKGLKLSNIGQPRGVSAKPILETSANLPAGSGDKTEPGRRRCTSGYMLHPSDPSAKYPQRFSPAGSGCGAQECRPVPSGPGGPSGLETQHHRHAHHVQGPENL
jgi:hypothetical protein